MDKTRDRSPFERLHISDAFENVLKAVVRNKDPRELELDAEQATAETIQKDDEG